MPRGYEDPASLSADPAAAWAGRVPGLARRGHTAAADAGRASGARHGIAVVSVLALALGLRLFGAIAFEGGAWQVGPCDDYSVHQISTILSTGNPLRVDVFYYPPVPAIVTATLTALWNATGVEGIVPTQCRLVSLLASLATVALVYPIGRFWGRRHGLVAMALYAVAMLPVTVQNNPPQVFATFFLTLALYFVLRAQTTGTTTALVLAGVCLGLGASSKYTPVFFAGILLMPYVLRFRSERQPGLHSDPADDRPAGTALARLWTAILGAALGVALAGLILGLVGRREIFGLLRQLYNQRLHENPFEYHLVSVTRLYRLALMVVGLVAAVTGTALLVPWWCHMSPWAWTKAFYARYRLWLLPAIALSATVLVGIALPAVLNPHDFARDFSYIANSRGRGDAGFFPQYRPGVSYIRGYLPESLGLPLYAAGLIGIIYCLVRRDVRALLLLGAALPTYAVLEWSRVKVSRYALDLVPLWSLVAAIWLADLLGSSGRRWRWAGFAILAGILVYSSVYSLAWAEFFSPRANAQTRAGLWLDRTVPAGASLGVKSPLLVSGSPELLPDAQFLGKYRLVDYKDNPEYILLPNSVRAIVQQYLEGLQQGYRYTEADWDIYRPSPEDLAVLSRIVREEGYVLLADFRKRPEVLGFELPSNSLTGRTWMIEHHVSSGLRVYRRER
jgi:Dolichyl-phosphate-mannose-protein mannosyltransferase